MLKPYAMHESDSRGRRWPEDPYDGTRGIYERDIDRVIHSRAFKRLAGKTQVISGRRSDHHRTRLTHSVEVAALCRSVARRLGIHEDLAACLGFCHDLGHPPLGHPGEDVFNEICRRFGDSFEHNRHTLTIVDEFEEKYAACPGLNLSFEVREGIVKHSRQPDPDDRSASEFDPALQPPLEAQLTDLCDEICYNFSDLDDAREGGFIDLEKGLLPGLPDFASVFERMAARYPGAARKLLFNESLRRLMNAAVQDLTGHTAARVREAGVETTDDVRRAPGRLAGCSPDMAERMGRLKTFLRASYYRHPEIQEQREENSERIRKLFDAYRADPSLLPRRYQAMIREGTHPVHRVIVYYMVGFTDFYLFQMAEGIGI